MPVLVALTDTERRQALALLHEEAGFDVVQAERGLVAFSVLASSREPRVALRGTQLGEPAATAAFLQFARLGDRWSRHGDVVLAPLTSDRWPLHLAPLVRSEQTPVLQLPNDLHALVPTVRQLQALQDAGGGGGDRNAVSA
jgi:hypothetical protein